MADPASRIKAMWKIGTFVSQVRTEMGKVAWPSKNELVSSTVVVLVSTLLLSVFIGLCDVVVARLINILLGGVVRQ